MGQNFFSSNVNGRILLLEVDIDGDIYLLLSFYNYNIELGQIHTFSESNNFLNKVADISTTKK